MPHVHVVLESPLPPDVVIAAAVDFTERRARRWRDVYVEHLTIHRLEDTRADVTEGNPWPILGVVWERLEYDWSVGDVVMATVKESNIFKQGSTWSLRVTAVGKGCRVEIDAQRRLKGRGRLLWPLFVTGLAAHDVRAYLQSFLDVVAAETAG